MRGVRETQLRPEVLARRDQPTPLVCLPRPPLFREALLFNARVAITGGHLLSDVRKSLVERVVPQEGLLLADGPGLAITI